MYAMAPMPETTATSKPQIFTRTMVEQTVMYFSDPKNADESNPQQMKELVGDFVKFEQVVERGLLTDDARELAQDFVLFAKEWIAKNNLGPVYAALKK